jgi:hypothetical protein
LPNEAVLVGTLMKGVNWLQTVPYPGVFLYVAEIIADPVPTMVTNPVFETVAIDGSKLVHVAVFVTDFATPVSRYWYACICSVCPGESRVWGGVTIINWADDEPANRQIDSNSDAKIYLMKSPTPRKSERMSAGCQDEKLLSRPWRPTISQAHANG